VTCEKTGKITYQQLQFFSKNFEQLLHRYREWLLSQYFVWNILHPYYSIHIIASKSYCGATTRCTIFMRRLVIRFSWHFQGCVYIYIFGGAYIYNQNLGSYGTILYWLMHPVGAVLNLPPELNMSMCENFHFLTRGIPI
jgi:hypothetical protein